MENKEIKLLLTLKDVNLILQSLGNMPYLQVAALVANITKQGETQINQMKENEQDN